MCPKYMRISSSSPQPSAAWAYRISWTQGHFFVFHNPEWIFHPENFLLWILRPSNFCHPHSPWKRVLQFNCMLGKKTKSAALTWREKLLVIVLYSQLHWLLSYPHSVTPRSGWRVLVYSTSPCAETITYLWSFPLPFFGFAIGFLRWVDQKLNTISERNSTWIHTEA